MTPQPPPDLSDAALRARAEQLRDKLSFPNRLDTCKHCDVDDYNNWSLCLDCQLKNIIAALHAIRDAQREVDASIVESANIKVMLPPPDRQLDSKKMENTIKNAMWNLATTIRQPEGR